MGMIGVLLAGLGSWMVPLYSWKKKTFSYSKMALSFGLALFSLAWLLLVVTQWGIRGDWAAVLDTAAVLRDCSLILIAGTFLLNALVWLVAKNKKSMIEGNHT